MGMNSSGGTRPRSGCRQRTRASTPTVVPVSMATTGWYTIESWSPSRAWCSADFDRDALGGPGREGLVEHLDPGPATLLGVVHGRVGLAEHVHGIVARIPKATPTLADTKHSTPSSMKGRSNAVSNRHA